MQSYDVVLQMPGNEADAVPSERIRSLPLDHADRPQFGHFFRYAGTVDGIDHFIDILVGIGHLLCQGAAPGPFHENTFVGQFAVDRSAPAALFGGLAAEHPSCAVTGGTKTLLHGGLCAGQHIGGGAHIPGDEDGLTDLSIGFAHGRVARWKSARGAFAVYTDGSFLSVNDMGLFLGDVVADVVDLVHGQVPRPDSQHPLKGFPGAVQQNLAVGPGVIGRTGHGGQVPLAGVRLDHGTGQLPVGQGNAQLADVFVHERQRIVADLIAQPAGSRVQQDGDLVLEQAIGPGNGIVENLLHDAHLQEVIAGLPSVPSCLIPR
jgi:hypothetical protein